MKIKKKLPGYFGKLLLITTGLLLRVTDRAGFADDGHLDLTGILHGFLDLLDVLLSLTF